MPEDTAMTIFEGYQASLNPVFSRALASLETSIEAAAQANLDSALAQTGDGFTVTEKLAMLKVESLKQVNGLDLAAVLLRAKFLREIERLNLLQAHPSGYTSMQEMARAQGISSAELSQTMALVNHVFPYIQNNLGVPVAQLWEEIGKSNFRELVPVLVSIITGEDSETETVRNSVRRILDDVAATGLAAGQTLNDTQIRQEAVEQLLNDGAHLTNRELRQRVRPERTQAIQASVVAVGGRARMIVAQIEDAGQWELFQRRLGTYVDTHTVNLPDDPVERQIEAARIPELRGLLNLLEGRNG